LTGIYHFLLVVCSDNVSNLHRFRDTTTSAVYVTACDGVTFRSPSVLIRKLKLQATYTLRIVCRHIVVNGMLQSAQNACKRSSGWINYDKYVHITQPDARMYLIA